MSEWIKTLDQMPPLNTQVLMVGGKRYSGMMVGWHNEYRQWLIESCSDTINVYPPTHWMPLPDPPRESK